MSATDSNKILYYPFNMLALLRLKLHVNMKKEKTLLCESTVNRYRHIRTV